MSHRDPSELGVVRQSEWNDGSLEEPALGLRLQEVAREYPDVVMPSSTRLGLHDRGASILGYQPRRPLTAARVQLTFAGREQAFLVATVAPRVDPVRAAENLYTQVAALLSKHRLEIVHERIFGSLSAAPTVLKQRHAALCTEGKSSTTPYTYLEGAPYWGEGLAGVIVHAVRVDDPLDAPWTIMDAGTPCGRAWRRDGVTFYKLQGLHGADGTFAESLSPQEQTTRVIERARRLLAEQGAGYNAVARTWFYLSDILSWYDEFNDARTAKYHELGLMPEHGQQQLLLPASTGIRCENRQGAAAMVDVFAVLDDQQRVQVRQLSNTRQQDAFCYGSAFSRGAVVNLPDVTLIQLSGTAAIDEAGRSLFTGDARAQIECTLDKVEALLQQAGASLADVSAATAFVKRGSDALVFWEVAAARGLASMPAVCVVADVCRDELLFEIDAEVTIPRT